MITKRKILITGVSLNICAFLMLCFSVFAQAPDATINGPLATTSSEYQFPAAIDPPVTPTQATEVWASLTRPSVLEPGTRYPLVVFLHGNHATCGTGSNPRRDTNCQYTTTGTCPAGFVVVPNHAGYEYLAENLASWGYLVVSINVNRGINCRNDGPPGDMAMNLARGRMVLRHLQRLSEWNNVPGTTPETLDLGPDGLLGKIDFSNVGLMGHSRGGEGMRAAYNQYPLASIPITDPVSFNAIFEIGPVDGQTSMQLNARNTVWNVLLPACDGDVSNLQGIKPFDRMMVNRPELTNPSQKSTYFVYGTNHNFYNTEWQQSDSSGCAGFGNPALFPSTIGSAAQRQTSLASVPALFRGNLVSPTPGAYDPNFNQNFNPQNSLIQPPTPVKRGYTNSPDTSVTSDCATILEDFDVATGTSSCGISNCSSPDFDITHRVSVPNHDLSLRAARINWSEPGEFFTTNSQPSGVGVDISSYATLDFRVSRQCGTSCATANPLNPNEPTDFSISLVQADGSDCGTLSGAVPLSNYFDPLEGPVGRPPINGGLHPILQTIRIPLPDFPNANLTNVRGVRFDFDITATGAIYMTNIRLSSVNGAGIKPLPESTLESIMAENPTGSAVNLTTIDAFGLVNRIRNVSSSVALNNSPGVEIEITSEKEFPVRGEIPILKIGAQEFALSRYPENGDTHTLIFTATQEEFTRANEGDPVTLQYGHELSGDLWNFGLLEKRLSN